MNKTPFLPLVLALCLQGCALLAPKLDVTVDGIASDRFSRTAGGSYYLMPAKDGLSGTLLWNEVRQRIGDAFAQEGMPVTDDFRSARFIARVEYEVSGPRTQVDTYVVPTYGVVGVTTTRHVEGGPGNHSSTTVSAPTYGVTGSRTAVSTRDVYTKRVVIHAHENTSRTRSGVPSFDCRETWVMELTNTDQRDDMRRLMPYMLKAASGLLGTDTHGRLVKSIRLDERRQDAPAAPACAGEETAE